ncbi:Tetratricopeptide TPR_2 repeat protein [Gloeothece citriformis PCC 7424]|uniref:Tetratricopeptide TPR_2 repeat protein n=1 Tax=Gloeothece citriformis (strain PCC 7424) TaxID=65393 RepID=B7KII4_GLOC7|nr:tetratricopeptide repeat protein [Gloeothece citriformis]ACK69390.1 Tetratricopeptide TPR_2 repeat protein [Gloeothece citriformis PCC 7424]
MEIKLLYFISPLIFNSLSLLIPTTTLGTSLLENPNLIQSAKSEQILEIAQNNADEIEMLSELIRDNPDDAYAYLQRGAIYAANEDYQKAIQDYNQSLTLDSNNAQAYNYRGTAYYWLENYQQALEDFNQALSLKPDVALLYYNRAYVRQKLGDKQGAIEDFKQGADISLKQGDTETYQKAMELIKDLEQ